MINGNIIIFICNKCKGIQTAQKRIKSLEYLKSYLISNGCFFLQETHSSISDGKKWEDEFNGKLFSFREKQIHTEF